MCINRKTDEKMRNKKISAFITALIFAVVVIFSGCTSDDNSATTETVKSTAATEKTTAETTADKTDETENLTASTDAQEETAAQSTQNVQATEKQENTGNGNSDKTPVATSPEATTQQATEPATAKPTEAPTEPQAKTCTININCSTILNNMDKLKEEKKAIVPANGVILSGCEIEVQEGDSVYDILVRACQQNKIHMDADYTPAYGSAYIKGIANLYERDCGSLSGWTYRVNGVFPGVGCSSYDANEGDVIEFLYTCDLGADVGNGFNG